MKAILAQKQSNMSGEDEDGLMSQVSLVGVELFSYVNASFLPIN